MCSIVPHRSGANKGFRQKIRRGHARRTRAPLFDLPSRVLGPYPTFCNSTMRIAAARWLRTGRVAFSRARGSPRAMGPLAAVPTSAVSATPVAAKPRMIPVLLSSDSRCCFLKPSSPPTLPSRGAM